MKCIYCGSNMQLGGIVTQGVSAMWFPQENLQKPHFFKIVFEGGISVGKNDYLWGQTLLTDAYYCPQCRKIIGIFDVKEGH